MSQKANIKLLPNLFQIAGPSALIAAVQVVLSNRDTPPDELKAQLDDVFVNWHVICAVSGEEILLSKLRYWNVVKQEPYARPELVPVPDCHNPLH